MDEGEIGRKHWQMRVRYVKREGCTLKKDERKRYRVEKQKGGRNAEE